jgi:hypothetical protein
MQNKLLLFILCCCSIFALQAQYIVQGEVKSSKNKPLIGVNILLNGTSIGTGTDAEGKFLINCPTDDPGMLVLTYLGFQEKVVQISKNMNG